MGAKSRITLGKANSLQKSEGIWSCVPKPHTLGHDEIRTVPGIGQAHSAWRILPERDIEQDSENPAWLVDHPAIAACSVVE
jgi:hypothetical protein